MRPMLALALQCAGRMTARNPLMLADPNGAPSSPWEKLVAWWDEDPDAVEVATELLDALRESPSSNLHAHARVRTPSARPPSPPPNWRAVRDDGWIIRCEIGTDAARDAGGTGRLATRTDASACASVDAAVAFDAESGYEPPQGSVRLLVPSRLLGEGRSFWKLEEVDERGVPKFVKWRVECPAGIQACPASTSAHGHPTPRAPRAHARPAPSRRPAPAVTSAGER